MGVCKLSSQRFIWQPGNYDDEADEKVKALYAGGTGRYSFAYLTSYISFLMIILNVIYLFTNNIKIYQSAFSISTPDRYWSDMLIVQHFAQWVWGHVSMGVFLRLIVQASPLLLCLHEKSQQRERWEEIFMRISLTDHYLHHEQHNRTNSSKKLFVNSLNLPKYADHSGWVSLWAISKSWRTNYT